MTEVEMVKWAGLDEILVDDERIKKLIWIAKQEARTEVWRNLGEHARMAIDMGVLSSYPGGLLKRRKNDQKK